MFLYTDTWVRYLGYTNEIGESFRAMIPSPLVTLTYVIASGYALADAVHKGNRTWRHSARIPIDAIPYPEGSLPSSCALAPQDLVGPDKEASLPSEAPSYLSRARRYAPDIPQHVSMFPKRAALTLYSFSDTLFWQASASVLIPVCNPCSSFPLKPSLPLPLSL